MTLPAANVERIMMAEDRDITVLVVEDEPLIRMALVDLLEEAGFNVQEAGDAAEAIVALHDRRNVQVLFTDLHMPPGIDGLALAHHAARHHPKIGIIIVSGHPAPARHLMPPGSSFLAKPYATDHVVSHVRMMTHPV